MVSTDNIRPEILMLKCGNVLSRASAGFGAADTVLTSEMHLLGLPGLYVAREPCYHTCPGVKFSRPRKISLILGAKSYLCFSKDRTALLEQSVFERARMRTILYPVVGRSGTGYGIHSLPVICYRGLGPLRRQNFGSFFLRFDTNYCKWTDCDPAARCHWDPCHVDLQ